MDKFNLYVIESDNGSIILVTDEIAAREMRDRDFPGKQITVYQDCVVKEYGI